MAVTSRIWEWIRARLSLFRPIERLVLDGVAEHLTPGARGVFEAQLRAINRVQRHAAGRQANLYRIVRGKARFDGALLFANHVPEAVLAKVVVRVAGSDQRIRAEIWVANGRVFSIEFDRSPPSGFAGFVTESVRVITDPEQMQPPREEISPALLSGKLAEWHRVWGLDHVRPPLPEEERYRLSQGMHLSIPDYRDVLEASEGFDVAGWRVHGLSEARTIPGAQEETLLVLAEADDVGSLVVSSQHPEELRLVTFDGLKAEAVGGSFVAAMEALLARCAKGA